MTASLGGVQAGRAFVVLDAIDRTGPVLQKVGMRLRAWGAEINQFANTIMRSAAVMLSPAVFSGRLFMGFDDEMRRVKARSQATGEEFQELTDLARKLGRETSSTATQVARLMGVLAQKGFKPEEILEMTPNVRNLAQAAGKGDEGDTSIAAQLVSATMKAFQMEAGQSQMVADMMTVAVNNSNFALGELMNAMSEGGTIMASMNFSLEETIALLAMMRDLSIPAQKAGVALKTMQTRMTNTKHRSDFNEQLRELTGQTVEFVDELNNLRRPSEILFEIAKAMKGLGTAQKGELLTNLFGTRGILGAAAIGDNVTDMEAMMTALTNLKNNAAETAKEMDAGFGGSFRRIVSMIVDAALAIGGSLEPALKELEVVIKAITQGVTKWVAKNAQVVVSFVKWTVAALGAAVALKIVGVALGILGTLITVAGGLIGMVVTGFVILAKVLAVTTFAFVWLIGQLVLLSATIPAVALAIPFLILAFVELMQTVFFVFKSILSAVFTFAAAVGSALTGLAGEISGIMGEVSTLLKEGRVEEASKLVAMGIELAFREAFDEIANAFKRMIARLEIEAKLFALGVKEGMGDIFLGDRIGENQQIKELEKMLAILDAADGKGVAGDAEGGVPGEKPGPVSNRIDELKKGMAELRASIEQTRKDELDAPLKAEKPDVAFKQVVRDAMQWDKVPKMEAQIEAPPRIFDAMEAGQAETMREIARLKGEGMKKPLDKLNNTAEEQVEWLRRIADGVEDPAFESIGP